MFENRYFGTNLNVVFLKDKSVLEIRSDQLSTIKVAKDYIMSNANMRGLMVQCKWNVSEKTLRRNLKFLRNKVREGKRL